MIVKEYKPKVYITEEIAKKIVQLSLTESYNTASRLLRLSHDTLRRYVVKNLPELDPLFKANGKINQKSLNWKKKRFSNGSY